MDQQGREVLHGWLDRIARSAEDLSAAEVALKSRRALRDRLVTAAVESGLPQRAVAKAAGVSYGRIVQLLLEQYDEEGQVMPGAGLDD